MTTIALKKKIYTKLKSTTKKSILEDVFRLLEIADLDDEPYQLSNSQIKKVKIAQNQLAEGKVKYHKEANKEVEKWLAK